jgi:two-component system chemotaxis response regulator CheY
VEVESEETKAAKKIDFIVLIDDDKVDNELHCEIISKAGLSKKVECFTHSLEAVTYFKNCLTEEPLKNFPIPDLVFLDFYMPFYNGFEFLDEFRKLRDPYDRKHEIRFVMLTGEVSPEMSLRAKTDYGDLLIACSQKPLDPDLLRKIAAKHF